MRMRSLQRSGIDGRPLWSEDERQQARELFRSDPHFGRIPVEDVPGLIDDALELGRARCDAMVASLGTRDPLLAAKYLEVDVLFDISSGGSIPVNVLSEYKRKPPVITVREAAMKSCSDKLARRLAADPKKIATELSNMCIAHELYHHLERRDMSYINFGYRIKVIDLGFLKIEKSLAAPAEIAAHSFAKRLLDLPFLPCVLHPLLFGEV